MPGSGGPGATPLTQSYQAFYFTFPSQRVQWIYIIFKMYNRYNRTNVPSANNSPYTIAYSWGTHLSVIIMLSAWLTEIFFPCPGSQCAWNCKCIIAVWNIIVSENSSHKACGLAYIEYPGVVGPLVGQHPPKIIHFCSGYVNSQLLKYQCVFLYVHLLFLVL